MMQSRKTRLGVGLLCLSLFLFGGIGWTIRVHRQQEERNSALLDAIKKSDRSSVQFWLAHGADANARIPEQSEPPLSLLDFCRKLCGAGFSQHVGGSTPLMVAAEIGDLPIVTMLVDTGADVNAHDKNGYTPLLCATENFYGHPGPIITLLAAHGADVNVKATDGETAWTYWRANPEIPKALEKASANK